MSSDAATFTMLKADLTPEVQKSFAELLLQKYFEIDGVSSVADWLLSKGRWTEFMRSNMWKQNLCSLE